MSADTQRAITALLADGTPDDPAVLHLARACRVLDYREGRLRVSLAPWTEGLLEGLGAGRVAIALRDWIADSIGVPIALDIRVERGGGPWTAGHSRVRAEPAPPPYPPSTLYPADLSAMRDLAGGAPVGMMLVLGGEPRPAPDMPLRLDDSPADASTDPGGGYPTSEASESAKRAAWIAWFGSADSLIGVSPSFSRGWDAAAGEVSALAAWLDWHRGVPGDKIPSVNLDFGHGFEFGRQWLASRAAGGES